MIVLDTSAVFAIVAHESDAERLFEVVAEAPECRLSAVTLYECRIVVGHRGGDAMLDRLGVLLRGANARVEVFDERQAELAHAAYRRFGRGSGHPAQLNLADCAAYALATSLGLPLLYKGDDFRRTGVKPAI